MRTYILSFFLLCLTSCVGSSVNNKIQLPQAATDTTEIRLPDISVSSLDGEQYNFPADFKLPYNVIAFGFAHEQKEATAAFMERIKNEIAGNTSFSVYKIPVIDSSNAALRTIIRNGMRSGTSDETLRKTTLTLFVNRDNFAKSLLLGDLSKPALMVFDQKGKLIWQTSDALNDQKIVEFRKSVNIN